MQSLSAAKADFLTLLAARIVPEYATLDHEGRTRFVAIVDGALMDRPAGVRRQFAAFLGLLRCAPVLRYGRFFEALSPSQQDWVLRCFEGCPIALLRKGSWGLKAMVFMGYYGQPQLHAELGYAPVAHGAGRPRARA